MLDAVDLINLGSARVVQEPASRAAPSNDFAFCGRPGMTSLDLQPNLCIEFAVPLIRRTVIGRFGRTIRITIMEW